MVISSHDDFEVDRPPYLHGGKWKLKRKKPITVILGKNGSGKSILLRNIRNLNKKAFHYCIPERTGNIKFEAGTAVTQASGDKRANLSNQNFVANYRVQIISRIQIFLTKRGGRDAGVEPGVIEKVNQTLSELLHNFRFKILTDDPYYDLQRVNGGKVSDITELSSGESELLSLGLDILLMCEIWKIEEEKGLLLIDEPDSHMHPDLQQKFAKFLCDIYDHYEFPMIIATHSTTLLSALGNYGSNKTSVIYLDNNVEDQIAEEFDKTLKTLSTCLGGHALMGPLFHFPIVLVEGEDDYRIWSEVPRHNTVKISVIPCNGDEIFHYQKILEKIFTSILDSPTSSTGYALLDGDKQKPNVPENHVKFIKLACHESENLYLTDEILSEFTLDWKNACTKVKQESASGAHVTELNKIESMDRKDDDFKLIIGELAQIFDKEKLEWTHRLGKHLGNHTPIGQLSKFLGDEVINAIWN